MQTTARSVILFATLSLGSFTLGAVSTSKLWPAPMPVPVAVAGASRDVQALPASTGDPSVPSASTVTFSPDQGTAAPTF